LLVGQVVARFSLDWFIVGCHLRCCYSRAMRNQSRSLDGVVLRISLLMHSHSNCLFDPLDDLGGLISAFVLTVLIQKLSFLLKRFLGVGVIRLVLVNHLLSALFDRLPIY